MQEHPERVCQRVQETKPRNEEIEDSHDVGRHEKPSKEELTERWVNER